MEAFMGTDAVMVVALKGWNTQGLRTSNPTLIHRGIAQLEVQTAQGVQLSHFDGSPGRWKQWHQLWFDDNARRMGIHFGHIPQGKLRFGMEATVGPESVPLGVRLQHLSGKWTISPLQIKPFSFKSIPPPAVVLRSVRIASATPGGRYVSGEIVFDLTGQAMNAQTPFGFAPTLLVGNRNQMGWGTSTTWNATPETPTRRVREFRLRKLATRTLPNGQIVPQSGQIFRLSGRANAGNCWPLSFAIEPFDCAKVKKGQTLKFKSWPAPIPKS